MNVKLSDIADALERSDVMQSFIDTKTGRVIVMGTDFDAEPKDDEAYPDAFQIEEEWERYVVLPNIYDDERAIMEDFAKNTGGEAGKHLLMALKGHGGVPRFERAARKQGLYDTWANFFRMRLLEIARDWCEEYDVKYDE